MDETITEWYILVVASDVVYGPLAEAEYRQLRQELGVPGKLDFSQTVELK